jgi:hypothetical protein
MCRSYKPTICECSLVLLAFFLFFSFFLDYYHLLIFVTQYLFICLKDAISTKSSFTNFRRRISGRRVLDALPPFRGDYCIIWNLSAHCDILKYMCNISIS